MAVVAASAQLERTIAIHICIYIKRRGEKKRGTAAVAAAKSSNVC